MELPSGERRKGPENYFESATYSESGDGGNCAGFTAVSLIRYLNLRESVETDLLLPEHRAISPLYEMPNPGGGPFSPGKSDIADYIHLYQARQDSAEFHQWWFGEGHQYDTPLEVFEGITQHTENDEPVAVSIFQYVLNENGEGRIAGHRMTAYRTEQYGNTGYISVYDNNWPNDATRRIVMNMTTGRWTYTLSPWTTWSGTRNMRYAPGTLNFSASLSWWHDHNTPTMLQSAVISGTQLGVEGDATLLITDDQGRKLGFAHGGLVSEIPGAGYLPTLEYLPERPNAPAQGTFYIPGGAAYDIAVAPTATGSYTLTAFADGSALSLDNVAITDDMTDTITLADGVREAAFALQTDTDYCHYITLEVSATASRDYTSCVSGAGAAAFRLDEADGSLTVGNNSTQEMTVDVRIDQVGSDAHTDDVHQVVEPGDEAAIARDADDDWNTGTDSGTQLYLPLVVR
jgi:hypothetical protein